MNNITYDMFELMVMEQLNKYGPMKEKNCWGK